MKDEILTIGSVVLLEGGSQYVMIVGYMYVDANDKSKVYDYNGCVYPLGLTDPNRNLLFNREQIKRVLFEGFVNEEGKTFLQGITIKLRPDNKEIIIKDINNK